LALPQLAMVGSRNGTGQGLAMATSFAQYLAQHGIAITSGLARGIDAASHRGALTAHGKTIAVLGSGIEDIHPKQNRPLAEEIRHHGAIISEFPIHEQARAAYFPKRNRIVSGLSLGVLVVEAAKRSGSLITARLAGEQGREVFAIPGSIHSPVARGCHRLIRQGATLVETAQDIITELGPLLGGLINLNENNSVNLPINDLAPNDKNLLECIGFEPTLVDQIIQRSGMNATAVTSKLTELEIAGFIRGVAGGYIKATGVQQ